MKKTKSIIIALKDNVYSVKNKILTKEEENFLIYRKEVLPWYSKLGKAKPMAFLF
jgi:hypothetical protein